MNQITYKIAIKNPNNTLTPLSTNNQTNLKNTIKLLYETLFTNNNTTPLPQPPLRKPPTHPYPHYTLLIIETTKTKQKPSKKSPTHSTAQHKNYTSPSKTTSSPKPHTKPQQHQQNHQPTKHHKPNQPAPNGYTHTSPHYTPQKGQNNNQRSNKQKTNKNKRKQMQTITITPIPPQNITHLNPQETQITTHTIHHTTTTHTNNKTYTTITTTPQNHKTPPNTPTLTLIHTIKNNEQTTYAIHNNQIQQLLDPITTQLIQILTNTTKTQKPTKNHNTSTSRDS